MPSEPLSRPRDDAATTVPTARRQRRRAWVLLAAAAWTAWVWLTRLSILLDDTQTAEFRLVHGVLIAVSLAFAVALAVIGWRMFQESRGAGGSRP